MPVDVEINFKNLERFGQALREAQKKVSDLTIPLILISKDFYRSQRAIFNLSGPGQYEDLSPAYKKEKQRAVGFVYPILKRSGALERSTTDPTDSNAVNVILDKKTLIIGTRVEYAAKHQYGVGVPARPFLFIGPESSYASSEQKGRLERWTNILADYVTEKVLAEGNGGI